MIKKFLPILNIVTNFLFIIFYIIARIDILPEDVFVVFIWFFILSGVVGILFLASSVFLWIKEKRFPSAFQYIVGYFLSLVWLVFAISLFYDMGFFPG